MISSFLSSLVQNLEPYVPGEQPQDKQYIKLNTNESPYGPSPRIRWEPMEDLRLYPDPNGVKLREAIARGNGLTKDEVFLGNGSDEVLCMAFMAFASKDLPLTFGDRTYSFYPVWAQLLGVPYQTVPLQEDLYYDLMACYEAVDHGPVVLCNPNAPTSTFVPVDTIREALTRFPDRLLIVDEAYIDFGGTSAVSLIHEHPNLLVIQTFSKSRALAGMRLGFAMGNKDLIKALTTVKNSINSYTVSRFGLSAGLTAYEDVEYFDRTRERIMKTRDEAARKLRELGFILPDSYTNFLWVTHPKVNGRKIYQTLKDRGILIRHFSDPRLEAYNRITVGTKRQMETLLRELAAIIEEEETA